MQRQDKFLILTFEQDAFNEIDALILSQISYLNFDGLVR